MLQHLLRWPVRIILKAGNLSLDQTLSIMRQMNVSEIIMLQQLLRCHSSLRIISAVGTD